MASGCEEEVLRVCPGIMDNPLGFSIDGGGSLYKLVYRSKQDYAKGKPLKKLDRGILRMRSFPVGEGFEKVLEWVLTNVDVNLTEKHEGIVWAKSGINMARNSAVLKEHFNISYDCPSEFIMLQNFLKHFHKTHLSVHPTNVDNVKNACLLKKEKMAFLRSLHTKSTCNAPDHWSQSLLSTSDYDSWVRDHLSHTGAIKTPSIFLVLGSQSFVMLLTENFELWNLDTCPAAGKSISAFAEEMFGEKDFDGFLKLAESGDSSKVDLCVGDLAEDAGTGLHARVVKTELGKLALGPFEHSKADLAAGVLSSLIHSIAKLTAMNVLLYKVDRAYVCGSLLRSEYARNLFERHFYADALSLPFPSQTPSKVHFFEKPGYLVSLGTWLCNVQKAKNS